MNRLLEQKRCDWLVFEFISTRDALASGDDALENLLALWEQHAGNLLPEEAWVETKMRYSRKAVTEKFRKRDFEDPYWSLILHKETEPEFGLYCKFHPLNEIKFICRLQVFPFEYCRDPSFGLQRAQRLVSFFRELALRVPPVSAHGHSEVDFSMGKERPDKRNLFFETQVHEVYWLNLYGKEKVDALGRARVLSTPAAHLEELPNGSVLFLTRPTPADFNSEEARVAQAQALVHLKPELSYDAVLATLRQRSNNLIPVTPDWDPDLVELLDLTLDTASLLKDRPREVARLNAWRPPPVSEWMPLQSAPLSDVGANARAVAGTLSRKAEGLFIMLGSLARVAKQQETVPQTLTYIDWEFWCMNRHNEERKEDVDRSYLVPAGAYLGEQLVDELGGSWVLRNNLEECYVALGDRAYLPFLRVQHYFQSHQAMLDYSMTKYFREAERYVNAYRASR